MIAVARRVVVTSQRVLDTLVFWMTTAEDEVEVDCTGRTLLEVPKGEEGKEASANAASKRRRKQRTYCNTETHTANNSKTASYPVTPPE